MSNLQVAFFLYWCSPYALHKYFAIAFVYVIRNEMKNKKILHCRNNSKLQSKNSGTKDNIDIPNIPIDEQWNNNISGL